MARLFPLGEATAGSLPSFNPVTPSGRNMPIIAAVVALIAPRILILALWFFTTWFGGMFDSLIWPILGLIFAPTTLLWYSAVQHWFAGIWSLWPVVGMVIAVLLDLSPASGRR